MKHLIKWSLCFLAAVSCLSLSAQEMKGIVRVSTSQDLLKYVPSEAIYILPEFRQAFVMYKNGSRIESTVNVCLIDNSVRFINESGDTLMLSNVNDVDRIAVDGKFLINDKGRFLRQVALDGDKVLCEWKQFSFEEPQQNAGYSGLPASSTAKKADVRSVDFSRTYGAVVEIPWRTRTTWMLTDGNRSYTAKQSSFIKLYPELKQQIKTYIKAHSVDFDNQEDLVALFQYCATTQTGN